MSPSPGAGLSWSHLTQSGRFKATLWMCEEFPLSLVEQVVPIIDLMARTSAHFARLDRGAREQWLLLLLSRFSHVQLCATT